MGASNKYMVFDTRGIRREVSALRTSENASLCETHYAYGAEAGADC